MKYIDIRPIVGGDARYWSMRGETVQYTHHMHYNSPYETDSDCGNCDGARCDGCRKIINPAHLEFSIYTDHLEKAIREATPELTDDEVSDLCYNDYCRNQIYHEGELYELVMPTEHWLKENYPDVLKKLSETVHLVEIQETHPGENEHYINRCTVGQFRFDTEEEAIKFLEQEREKYMTTHGIVPGIYKPENDTGIWNYFAKFEPDQENDQLIGVCIFRHRYNYGDFLHHMYSGFLHYNGKIYEYKEAKIVDITEVY